MGAGGTVVRPPCFRPLLKIHLGNPYLKFLDLTKLFIADAPMKKPRKIYVHPLLEHIDIWVEKTAHVRKGFSLFGL